ncbi:MAG: rRNA maturation RNase YbeY [Deltaproteobacteria bacterium]|nr:rRNA maturation RNase YbeY [Deltaproteobacteria bacterium]
MGIRINSRSKTLGLKTGKIKRKLRRVLKDLDFDDKELSILLTDDDEIARLNRSYLGRKGPTNVLAFPMMDFHADGFEGNLLGDVVISIDTALRQSEESGASFSLAFDRLVIHGLLHLLGYDHEQSEPEARRMEEEEERLLTLMGH